MKTLTLILTDGPYISEYTEMAYKIAKAALGHYKVNIFLYLDGVHIPKAGQRPNLLTNARDLLGELAAEGITIRACLRCSTARGYKAEEDGSCKEYPEGIKITSLYDLAAMIKRSDKVISISR